MGLHDRPTVAEILAAVRGYLRDEVAPAGDRRARFRALVAINVLEIAERELGRADADACAENEGLRALGYGDGPADERRAKLAAAIRAGEFDGAERFAAASGFARAMVERKLEVSNPRFRR